MLLASLAGAPPAAAILTRLDRDDAEYLELASRYTSAFALPSGGEGVLIAPRWILTAAHRAKALQEMKPAPRLQLGGRAHEIQAVFLHPDWKAGEANDIALIVLRRAASGIEPTPAYRDADESGKPVVIVGHGTSGRIGDKARIDDGRRRAAINTIDRVTPRTLGLRIKAGDEASDLQGSATAADSGAPAFIETPQGLFVAGILGGADGEWETYARVSGYMPWIGATMHDAAVEEARNLLEDR